MRASLLLMGLTAVVAAASPRAAVAPIALQTAPGTAQVRITYPASRLPILTLPNGQKRTVRSVLNVAAPMRFGDFVWNTDGVPQGPSWVRVDLAAQTLSVFRGGHEIGTAVILYGADSKQTPGGVFPILGKARTHWSSLYDAPMPFMLRLTGDGVAIHASNVRERFATHGCIGVPPGFAKLLFAQMNRGDLVAIEVAPKIRMGRRQAS